MRYLLPLAWLFSCASFGICGSSAEAQSAPYSAKWYFDDLVEVKRLEFTVLADRLEIVTVVVNKGNCPIATTTNGAIELSVNDAVLELGQTLSDQRLDPLEQTVDPAKGFPLSGVFGESLSVYVPNSCNILLVDISTSMGNWSSSFSP